MSATAANPFAVAAPAAAGAPGGASPEQGDEYAAEMRRHTEDVIPAALETLAGKREYLSSVISYCEEAYGRAATDSARSAVRLQVHEYLVDALGAIAGDVEAAASGLSELVAVETQAVGRLASRLDQLRSRIGVDGGAFAAAEWRAIDKLVPAAAADAAGLAEAGGLAKAADRPLQPPTQPTGLPASSMLTMPIIGPEMPSLEL